MVGDHLHALAGSYLHSIVRDPALTCSVCSTPRDREAAVCLACASHIRSGAALADRVASLIYAPYDTQAYQLVRQYKTDFPGPTTLTTMKSLLAVGLRGHYVCATRLAACSQTFWAVVPSTRGRPALLNLVTSLAKTTTERIVIEYDGASGRRAFEPSAWTTQADVPQDAHLVLIDDSWVSGAHAQSAASAMKAHGFSQVSVLTAARVLNPDFPANSTFVGSSLRGFDWRRCPWTGSECP